jgi:hypothetical protein
VAFFDTHDMGEYLDQLSKAESQVNIKTRKHHVEVDEAIVPKLNEIAKSKKVPSEKLINTWLREKIETSKRV